MTPGLSLGRKEGHMRQVTRRMVRAWGMGKWCLCSTWCEWLALIGGGHGTDSGAELTPVPAIPSRALLSPPVIYGVIPVRWDTVPRGTWLPPSPACSLRAGTRSQEAALLSGEMSHSEPAAPLVKIFFILPEKFSHIDKSREKYKDLLWSFLFHISAMPWSSKIIMDIISSSHIPIRISKYKDSCEIYYHGYTSENQYWVLSSQCSYFPAYLIYMFLSSLVWIKIQMKPMYCNWLIYFKSLLTYRYSLPVFSPFLKCNFFAEETKHLPCSSSQSIFCHLYFGCIIE